MLKRLTLLALASVTMAAMAQQDTTTTTTTTQNNQGTATTPPATQPPMAPTPPMMQGGMNYNMSATSNYDKYRQVIENATWLSGGDQYYFQKQLSMMTGPEEHAAIKALYSLGGWGTQLRWESGVARMNQEWPTYAMSGTTVTDTTGGTTTTQTTTTYTAPSSVYTWDTNSDSARALRFAYEQKPRNLDYRSAAEILGSGLDSTEKGIFFHWWGNADERAKDIMVRLIGRQLAWADITPLRIYFMDRYPAR